MNDIHDLLKTLIGDFFPFAKKRMGFQENPSIWFKPDERNAADPFGKTAHYDPSSFKIVLYTTKRHPKDILRSLSHELVHHTQNCRGDLTSELVGEAGPNYAQTNKHLREMEREAYEEGNLCFRDWEDRRKNSDIRITLNEACMLHNTDEEKSTKQWYRENLNRKLIKKFLNLND